MKKNKVMPNNGVMVVQHGAGKKNDFNQDISFKPSFFQQPPFQNTTSMETATKKPEEKEDEKAEEKHGIMKTLIDFSESTTAHGFGHIMSSTSILTRLMWATIMIGLYIVLIIVIGPLITKYLERPLVSKQSLVYERKPHFPAIVICNENIAEKEPYEELLNSLNESYDSIDPIRAMQKVESQSLNRYGHKFNTTILKCDFRHVENSCLLELDDGRQSWLRYWNPRFGTCWGFNLDLDNPLHVTRTGPQGGLHMHLDTQQEKYIKDTASAGFRVFIGNQGEEFDLEDKVILIAPGKKYDISVSKHLIQRADPFENGTCIKNKREAMIDHTSREEYHINKITHKFCNKLCASRKIIEVCNCAILSLPLPIEFKDVKNCLNDEPCPSKIMQEWYDDELVCDCQPACDQTIYRMNTYFQEYPSQVVRQKEISEGRPDPRKNLLSVNIYFQEKVFSKSEEMVYYTLVNLIADMGGQLGLFGGFSVLTVVEFLVLFFVLIFKLNLKCFNANNNKL